MHVFTLNFQRLAACATAACGIATVLGGCGSFDTASNSIASVITPYRMDVVQGNVVTKEQIELLKPGMPRATVRDVMGTSLLTSVFHADRWDYIFTFKRQGAPYQERKVSIYFKGDLLDRVVADPLPTEAEFVSTLDSGRFKVKPTARKLEATQEELRKFTVAPKNTQEPLPPTLPAAYPPLEPAGR